MAKFTKEQVEQAKAEFFQSEDLSIEWGRRPASGLNGPITVYTKVEVQSGSNETASE